MKCVVLYRCRLCRESFETDNDLDTFEYTGDMAKKGARNPAMVILLWRLDPFNAYPTHKCDTGYTEWGVGDFVGVREVAE